MNYRERLIDMKAPGFPKEWLASDEMVLDATKQLKKTIEEYTVFSRKKQNEYGKSEGEKA